MAWHRLVTRFALPCSLVIALACKNGEGDLDIGEEGEDFDSMQFPTTGDDTTTTSSTSATTMASATDSGSGTGSTTAATGSTSADSTTGPDEPVVCTEDLTCNPGEICVLPCCGGPAPGCFELPKGGECGPGGTPDPDGANCCQNAGDPVACMKLQWCSPVGCTPDPPYCAAAETVSCNDDQCTAEGGCYGMLFEDGQLQCSCK